MSSDRTAYHILYRQTHREQINRRARERRAVNPDAQRQAYNRWYAKAKESGYLTEKWKLDYDTRPNEYHKRHLVSQRKHRDKRREEILDFFGRKCVRCGFSDSRALQIDHINGNGAEDRRIHSAGSLWGVPKLIEENPDRARKELQLLCANCNWIKRFENKEVSRWYGEVIGEVAEDSK